MALHLFKCKRRSLESAWESVGKFGSLGVAHADAALSQSWIWVRTAGVDLTGKRCLRSGTVLTGAKRDVFQAPAIGSPKVVSGDVVAIGNKSDDLYL